MRIGVDSRPLREAQTSGDRVAAENLYQHAEHYFRIMNALGENQGQGQGPPRPMTPADAEISGVDGEPREGEEAQVQSVQQQPLTPLPGDEQPPNY